MQKYTPEERRQRKNAGMRQRYKENRDRLLAQSNQRGRERTAFLQEYKLSKGCQICGYNKNPAVLHFHHRNPSEKSFSVGADAARHTIADLKMEMEKCDILCANCHIERTHPMETNNATRLYN